MRKKMNLKDVMKKDHYRGIIYLLRDFGMQYHKKAIKGIDGIVDIYSAIGLKQIHFRFALMENPAIYEPTYKKLKQFFNNREIFLLAPQLNKWYKYNNIVKSIKSPQKLTNYLDKLVELGFLEKHGKKPRTRYCLSQLFYRDESLESIKKDLNIWQSCTFFAEWFAYEYVLGNDNTFTPNLNEIRDIVPSDNKKKKNEMIFEPRWFLSGIPLRIYDKLSDDEKAELKKWLLEIDKNLWNIMKLKCQKTDQWKDRSNVKETGEFNSNELNSIGFYYTSSLSYLK